MPALRRYSNSIANEGSYVPPTVQPLDGIDVFGVAFFDITRPVSLPTSLANFMVALATVCFRHQREGFRCYFAILGSLTVVAVMGRDVIGTDAADFRFVDDVALFRWLDYHWRAVRSGLYYLVRC